jgi:NAD(P)-dependent dehydrogenase (short-subunit alcohol dehydrogenase family)
VPPREDREPGTFWEECDVTDRGAVEGALASGLGRIGGPPAALVHCAGIYVTSPSEEADLAVWERVLAVNATGSFHLASLVGRHLLAAGSGSIVLLSSIAWALGDSAEPSAAYAASKGAVVSLGRQLATEWGPRGV